MRQPAQQALSSDQTKLEKIEAFLAKVSRWPLPKRGQLQVLDQFVALGLFHTLVRDGQTDPADPSHSQSPLDKQRLTLQKRFLRLMLPAVDRACAGDDAEERESGEELLYRLCDLVPYDAEITRRFLLLLLRHSERAKAIQRYRQFTETWQQVHATAFPYAHWLEALKRGDSAMLDIAPTKHRASAEALESASMPVLLPEAHDVPSNEPFMPPAIPRQSPFTGRQHELGQLVLMLHHVQQDAEGSAANATFPLATLRRSHFAMLAGEAGIGKTRLVEELCLAAQKDGWRCFACRCYFQESGIPYHPWTALLRLLIRHAGEDAWFPGMHHLSSLSQLLPELSPYTLSAATTTNPPANHEESEIMLWEAIHDFLIHLARVARQPVLLFIDDVQWADSKSINLLAYLARRFDRLPLAFLATCREEEQSEPLTNLMEQMLRDQTIHLLHLAPLAAPEMRQLVALYVPEAHEQEPILTQAAGNPFFAEELAKALQVGSTRSTSGAAMTTMHAPAVSPLPHAVAAALDYRVRRLSEVGRQLLNVAAVLDGAFSLAIIAAMLDHLKDENRLIDALDELLAAGVLREEGEGAAINYRIQHPLLVAHLYGNLSASRRALLHRQAARIFQQQYQHHQDEGAGILAYHLLRAGADRQAILEAALRAAEYAHRLSAYIEAEQFYRMAFAQLPAGTDARLANVWQDNHLARYLLECLAECVRSQGRFKEAHTLFEQVVSLHGEPVNVDETASEWERTIQIRALLLLQLALTAYDVVNYSQANEYCEQAEYLLQAASVERGPARARIAFQRGYLAWMQGKYEQAERFARDALNLFQQRMDTIKQSSPPFSVAFPALPTLRPTATQLMLIGDPVDAGRCANLLGVIAATRGNGQEAIAFFQQAVMIFEQSSRFRELAWSSCNVGDVLLRKAEHRQARQHLERAWDLAQRMGDQALEAVILDNLGTIELREQRLHEAAVYYQRGIMLAESIDDIVETGILYAAQALACCLCGSREDARRSLLMALRIGRNERGATCRGQILIALGQYRLQQALVAVGQLQGWMLFKARKALTRALTLNGLDVEVQTKALLLLAQVDFHLQLTDQAHQEMAQARNQARQYGLLWLARQAEEATLRQTTPIF